MSPAASGSVATPPERAISAPQEPRPNRVESPRVVDAQNPWPGLDAFDETTAAFFNGREAESAELARLVEQAPLTVLFGKSGLGKTSLLQAGLFPLLRESGFLPVYVRLAVQDERARLIDQLEAALLREVKLHGIDMEPFDFKGSLWERLHHKSFALWSATNDLLTPVFVLDQSEEVFTLGAANPAAIKRLQIDLADLIENRMPASLVQAQEQGASEAAALEVSRQRYKVLLSLREDFLPDLEGWRRDIPSLMRNRFRLRAMNAKQAFDAVYETGRPGKLVDGKTAEAIVRFVGKIQSDERAQDAGMTAPQPKAGEEPGEDLSTYEVEPALLSLVCAELNKLRQSSKPPQSSINADLLKGTGASIIADFYLRQVAKAPAATRKFIEEELLTEGGYRNSFPIAEALKEGHLSQETLTRLVDGRLLRVDQQLGSARVELTHDRLTDVVRAERDKRRQKERSARQRNLMQVGAVLGLFVIALVFWAGSSWWARIKSDAALAQAEKALAEAKQARAEAERQRALAEARRIEAEQQRQAAEDARRKILDAQAYAESQRRIAEQEQEKAKVEAQRAQEQAERVKRQNAILGEAFAPLRPAVLRLQVQGGVRSTAFFVSSSGHVVTAGHVVERADPGALTGVTFQGATLRIELLKVDRSRDLALLRTAPAASTACLELADEPPKEGTSVVALSISLKTDWAAVSGTVLRVNVTLGNIMGGGEPGRFEAKDLIEVEIDAEGGFSGAPVVDPVSRRVIGIGAYGMARESRRHYLIPASRIRAAFGPELGRSACTQGGPAFVPPRRGNPPRQTGTVTR